MKSDYEEVRDRQYYKQVNYENVLSAQLNRIADFYTKRNFGCFVSGVDALVIMIPSDMRNKALAFKKEHSISQGQSESNIELYTELWMYCNQLLEEGDLIFKIGKGPSEFGVM